ncbi:TniQ family protein [Psychrobacter sp. DM4]|uniref:TniQ family protein n=1 Tax=Psychrobacter sp. DM4 TaxID=3440637 RepID=UPI003F4F6637
MSETYQRATQNYWVKPLTFATPFLYGESLTSWLVRAALKHGCSPLTFTYYYWPQYRIWTYDADKGFSHFDGQITSDIAILTGHNVDTFDDQILIDFSEDTSIKSDNKSPLQWTTPLSKRNRYSRLGYPYCPDCMEDDKEAYLKLQWRFTWSVCCTKHKTFLQVNCGHCNQPYQPQLLSPEQRFINRCHSCLGKMDQAISNAIPSEALHKFQQLADEAFYSKQGIVLGQVVSMVQWFEHLLFLINLVRRGLKNPNYMFGKLIAALGIDTDTLSLPKTALRFDFLPVGERVALLECAYRLLQVDANDWINVCFDLDITQNSFQWSKSTVTPKAFSEVHDQLHRVPTRSYGAQSEDMKPASPKVVMASWNRLKRKMQMRDSYDKHKKG